jgi:hypothetical protein
MLLSIYKESYVSKEGAVFKELREQWQIMRSPPFLLQCLSSENVLQPSHFNIINILQSVNYVLVRHSASSRCSCSPCFRSFFLRWITVHVCKDPLLNSGHLICFQTIPLDWRGYFLSQSRSLLAFEALTLCDLILCLLHVDVVIWQPLIIGGQMAWALISISKKSCDTSPTRRRSTIVLEPWGCCWRALSI